jgi:hypothetical protein
MPRYFHALTSGELKATHFHLVSRFFPRDWKLANLVRGCVHGNDRYRTISWGLFACVIIVFAYMSILLSPVQLGLATTHYKRMPLSTGLHLGLQFCPWFSAPIGAALMLFLFLFIFYECSAGGFQRDGNIRHDIHPPRCGQQGEKGE